MRIALLIFATALCFNGVFGLPHGEICKFEWKTRWTLLLIINLKSGSKTYLVLMEKKESEIKRS